MSEERHIEHTEHVEREAPAGETVEAAAAAVALAETTAAAAELQAAEQVRTIAEESAAWRTGMESSVGTLNSSLTHLREEELLRHASERNELREALTGLSARLEAMETRLPPSTPQPSGENPGTVQPETIAGAAGEAQVGPIAAEAGASLGAARRRRKWI